MKKLLFLSTLIFLFSFQTDDLVEVEHILNARSSANYLSTATNIRTQLELGTKGMIKEIVKLPSGNFGLKIKIMNGKYINQSFWVYYNINKPALLIVNKNDQVIKKPEVETRATAQRKIASIKDPEDSALIDSVKAVTQNNASNIATNLNPKSPDCLTNPTLTSTNDAKNYNESMSIPPFKEINEAPLHSQRCNSVDVGYDVCKTNKDLIESFNITNHGGNKIVTKNEYYINRQYSFEFEEQARSDMRLMIVDSPDDTTSHTTTSVMLFFPRSVLPSIKKVNDTLEVTLPNKEVVKYDAKTHEVIGGVLTEGPMIQDERGKAKPAALTYTGSGVLIRADKNADYPMGDMEIGGKKVPSTVTATISKKGFKDCKVPSKELWYTDYNKEANVFIKKEFASDAGLDEFIKKKCGFSIF